MTNGSELFLLMNWIGKLPIVRSLLRRVLLRPTAFKRSESYWEIRYSLGGLSGVGSYGKHAEFKAKILNNFVREHRVRTLIEFGCGDGNQLTLADFPDYCGFDVSAEAVSQCRAAFARDRTKRFGLVADYAGESAEAALSLDVIYHLIEDDVFELYLDRLFRAATRFVVIYATDADRTIDPEATHVRHREWTRYVTNRYPGWKHVGSTSNPFQAEEDPLHIRFFFFAKR